MSRIQTKTLVSNPLFGLAVMVALAGCGSSGSSTQSSPTLEETGVIEPPDVQVAGLTVAEARARLAAAGWQSDRTHDRSRFGIGGYFSLDDYDPEWVVCSQRYVELVDGTRKISLDSAPSCTVTLPNLVGSTLGDAQRIAEETGLWVDEEPKEDSGPDWIVCEQQPPPGRVNRKVEDSLSVGLTPPGADC